MNTTQQVPLSLIDIPGSFREHTMESVDALAQDIQRNGQLQEIIVTPKEGGRYELVAGKRRTLAMRHLNWENARAQVMDGLSELQKALIMIAENDEREDVNPFDRALSYQRALKALDNDQRKLADQLGTSEKVVSDVLGWLKFTPEVTEDLRRRKFSGAKLTELARLPDAQSQLKMVEACDKQGWSSKVLRDKVSRMLAKGGNEVPENEGNGDDAGSSPDTATPSFQFRRKGDRIILKARPFIMSRTDDVALYANALWDAFNKFMEEDQHRAKAA